MVVALVFLLCRLSQHAAGCEVSYQTRLAGAAVHAGEPVMFRAHGAATGPPSVIAYHFHFSSATSIAEATLTTAETMPPGARLTRTFEQGVQVVTVYCRPPATPEVGNGSNTVLPVVFWPLVRVRFDVLGVGVRFCYEYRVEQLPAPVVLTPGGEIADTSQSMLLASVWDKSEPTIERAAHLTAQLLTMHAAPNVHLSSMTKSGPAAVLPVHSVLTSTGVRDGWQIVVPDMYDGPMDAPLELHLSPPNRLSLMGCSVASNAVHLSRTRRSLPYATPYAVLDIQPSMGGIDVGDPSSMVGAISTFPNPCQPSELTLLVEELHGGLSLLLSNDIFDNLQLAGTAGSFTRINNATAWVCAELQVSGTPVCPVTQVYSALPLVSGKKTELLLNTREGVVHFSAAVPTRPSALTNLSSAVPVVHGKGLRMSATTHSPCTELQSSPVVCVYLIASHPKPAVWTSCSADFEQAWYHETFSTASAVLCGIGAVGCGWTIDSAVRDFYRHADVFLVSVSGQSSSVLVSTNLNADAAARASLGLHPGFSFSTPDACDGAVSNMLLHSNGHELIAYGRQIWTSADGGYAFHCLATLPDGQTATQVVTTTFQSGFAVISNTKQVYYGRTGVAHLAAVASQLSQYQAPVLHWTAEGVLLAYDVGSTGATADQLNISIHSLVSLPIDESVVTDDLSFEIPLVLSWFAGNILIWCGGGVNCFSQAHLGRRIVMETGGSVQIVSINNRSTASGIVVDPLQPDLPAMRQTQLLLSKASGFIRSSAVECQKWMAVLRHVDSRTRWQFNDRGKTLLTNGLAQVSRQSYIVSDVINDTHAFLIQYSNACPENGGSTVTVEPSSWLVFDLRGYTEVRSTHADQLDLHTSTDSIFLTVAAPVNGIDGANAASATVQLKETSGTAATHITFITEDGAEKWGLICDANSASEHGFQVQLPHWSVPPGDVIRVSRWSAFAVESMKTTQAGTPIFRKQRPWRLAVPPCDSGDIVDPQAATRSPNIFHGDGGHWLGAMVRFVDLNQREEFRRIISPQCNAPPILRVTRIHPHAVHSSVSRTFAGFNTSRDSVAVTVTLSDGPDRLSHPSSIVQFALLPLDLDSSGSAASLRCSIGAQTAIIFPGCQPNTKLLHADTTGRSLLLQHSNLDPGRWTTLRKNYRPPSSLGRAVPTTDNIYNADPAVPREAHFERYAVSRDSGKFKHCLGKHSREACACPAEIDVAAQPNQLAVTDCVKQVFTVHFSVPFVPHLIVVLDSAESPPRVQQLGVRYELEELNGRTDFCINRTASEGGGCDADGNAASARKLVVDPGAGDAMVWAGAELYHFRATVNDATAASLCEMETEFLVFVDALSMQPETQYLVMSSTAMASVLAILVVYVSNVRLVEV